MLTISLVIVIAAYAFYRRFRTNPGKCFFTGHRWHNHNPNERRCVHCNSVQHIAPFAKSKGWQPGPRPSLR